AERPAEELGAAPEQPHLRAWIAGQRGALAQDLGELRVPPGLLEESIERLESIAVVGPVGGDRRVGLDRALGGLERVLIEAADAPPRLTRDRALAHVGDARERLDHLGPAAELLVDRGEPGPTLDVIGTGGEQTIERADGLVGLAELVLVE